MLVDLEQDSGFQRHSSGLPEAGILPPSGQGIECRHESSLETGAGELAHEHNPRTEDFLPLVYRWFMAIAVQVHCLCQGSLAL